MAEWIAAHSLIAAAVAAAAVGIKMLPRITREVILPFLAILAPRRIRRGARRVLKILVLSPDVKTREVRQESPLKRCKHKRRRRRPGRKCRCKRKGKQSC